MAKPKRRYACQACGSVSQRWQGQCPDCSEWNTLVEEAPATVFSAKHDLSSGGRAIRFEPLDAPNEKLERRTTGLAELDRALGGGLVPGSAILMGGDPGIGKSTLLMQAAGKIALSGGSVVYISGEEAAGQVRMRAERMGLAKAPVQLASATSVRDILNSVERVTGRGVPYTAAPRRDGDPPALYSRSTRARTELGWIPQFEEVDTIVETAWRWRDRHPQGYPKR